MADAAPTLSSVAPALAQRGQCLFDDLVEWRLALLARNLGADAHLS